MSDSLWFSRNPDKAWAEKFYLGFIPVFFAYNAVVQRMGWLDVGTGWHVVQNLGAARGALPDAALRARIAAEVAARA